MRKILIKRGLLSDPVRGTRKADLLVSGGRISRVADGIKAGSADVLDADGLWVFPGFIDMHVHAREPGCEAAETLESAAGAAAAGGITSALLMPNTSPPMATPALLKKYRGRTAGLPARLYFSAAATAGRKGLRPSDLAALKKAGAIAFTDDGSCLPRGLLPGLIAASGRLGLPLLDHPEDLSITGRGVINSGAAAERLRLPGIPREAELLAVISGALAASGGGRLHLQHLSLGSSVDALRAAKACGWKVTGETCPHYFSLSDSDIRRDDAAFKMKPPLRAAADREAVIRGLADGTIDVIASDHAPHEARLKAKGFRGAPFGIIGLETLVPLCMTELVLPGKIAPARLAALLSLNPARILGLRRKGRLLPGYDADLTLVDPRAVRRVPREFASRSANSPFIGRKLRGWPLATVLGGRPVRS